MDQEPLREGDVDADPIVEFRRWYEHAATHGTAEPDAMVVATAAPDGRPSARVVLLRGVDQLGFRFYSSRDSAKGRELAANPVAALVFHWPEVHRQVRVSGRVEAVADAEADIYWANRPRASRLSAWASEQSAPIGGRAELEARVAEVAARFPLPDVPRPPFWGGYLVVPHEIELWQHRDDRLHDRLVYRRHEAGWDLQRLQP
jgi:pyridoxamine 5'-phosphate oxidase